MLEGKEQQAAPVEEEKKPVPAELVKTESDIEDPYKFALAQKERADRISKKLSETEAKFTELSETNARLLEEQKLFVEKKLKLENDIKKQHANMALKNAGIDDEDLLGIFSEDLVKLIKLDDNLNVSDATYLERAKVLGTKTKVSAKQINVLSKPAGTIEEQVPKTTKGKLLHSIKKMRNN